MRSRPIFSERSIIDHTRSVEILFVTLSILNTLFHFSETPPLCSISPLCSIWGGSGKGRSREAAPRAGGGIDRCGALQCTVSDSPQKKSRLHPPSRGRDIAIDDTLADTERGERGRTAGPGGRGARTRCPPSAPCELVSGPNSSATPRSADTSSRSAKSPITSGSASRSRPT